MATVPGKHAVYNGVVFPSDSKVIETDAHGLHYGSAAFEGIRAYLSDDGILNVFRLKEHLDRLFYGVAKLHMGGKGGFRHTGLDGGKQFIGREEFEAQLLDLIAMNFAGQDNIYIRPIVFFDRGLGVTTRGVGVSYSIIVQKWTDYLGGKTMLLSDIARPVPEAPLQVFDPNAKLGGQYVIGVMAKQHAQAIQLEPLISEPLMLGSGKRAGRNGDRSALMAEASGASAFVQPSAGRYKGKLLTPPLSDGVLNSITRNTVMGAFGLEVAETSVPIDLALRQPMRLFLTGTAVEISMMEKIYVDADYARSLVDANMVSRTTVRIGEKEVVDTKAVYQNGEERTASLLTFNVARNDRRNQIGRLPEKYQDIVRARNPKYLHWLTQVPKEPRGILKMK